MTLTTEVGHFSSCPELPRIVRRPQAYFPRNSISANEKHGGSVVRVSADAVSIINIQPTVTISMSDRIALPWIHDVSSRQESLLDVHPVFVEAVLILQFDTSVLGDEVQ